MVQPGGKLSSIKLPIVTQRSNLRVVRPSDASTLVISLNDKTFSRTTATMPFPYGPKNAQHFIERSPVHIKTGEALNLVIAEKQNDELVGGIEMRAFDWSNMHAELGYWVSK